MNGMKIAITMPIGHFEVQMHLLQAITCFLAKLSQKSKNKQLASESCRAASSFVSQ